MPRSFLRNSASRCATRSPARFHLLTPHTPPHSLFALAAAPFPSLLREHDCRLPLLSSPLGVYRAPRHSFAFHGRQTHARLPRLTSSTVLGLRSASTLSRFVLLRLATAQVEVEGRCFPARPFYDSLVHHARRRLLAYARADTPWTLQDMLGVEPLRAAPSIGLPFAAIPSGGASFPARRPAVSTSLRFVNAPRCQCARRAILRRTISCLLAGTGRLRGVHLRVVMAPCVRTTGYRPLGPPSLCVPMVAPTCRSRPACSPRLGARGVNAPGSIGLTPTPPICVCRAGSPQPRLAAPRAASVHAGPFSAAHVTCGSHEPPRACYARHHEHRGQLLSLGSPCRFYEPPRALLRKAPRAPRMTAVARELCGFHTCSRVQFQLVLALTTGAPRRADPAPSWNLS
ncbi:hypothetical protein B0H14DRAFT_3440461 [Mycena olivaceomarginata]|nr:hypothetical protein B0H14DRAFT_3440461 [Mycena olivaceomarginata]